MTNKNNLEEKTCRFSKEGSKCSIEFTREIIHPQFYSNCDFDLKNQPYNKCNKYLDGCETPPLVICGMPFTLISYDTGETFTINKKISK